MSAAGRDGADKTPFLRTSNVLWDEIDLSTVDEMAIPKHELPAKLLRPGDLLVCEGGEIGRAAIWNGDIEIMSFQNHLHRLRPLVDDVEPRFYVYFLQSAFTQLGLFEGAGNKTTIPNLSRNRLAAFDVPHPSLNEQRGIVSALARVREAIQLHDRSTILAQELKRTAMRELFTRGLRGEAQKETEIGPMPESWDLLSLSAICSIVSGGTPPKSDVALWDGTFPWVSGKDLKASRLSDSIDHITLAAAAEYSRVAGAGSVLVLVRGMGLANGFGLTLIDRPMAFNQDLKALVPSERVSGLFLMHTLTYAGERMLRNVSNAAHGTKRLSQDDLASFKVGVPAADEQREIVAILDAIDCKIDLHRQKRAVLGELFKALLHKLMTGAIQVADLNLSALHASSFVMPGLDPGIHERKGVDGRVKPGHDDGGKAVPSQEAAQ
jgi:type I restriction enzyme S subunit